MRSQWCFPFETLLIFKKNQIRGGRVFVIQEQNEGLCQKKQLNYLGASSLSISSSSDEVEDLRFYNILMLQIRFTGTSRYNFLSVEN